MVVFRYPTTLTASSVEFDLIRWEETPFLRHFRCLIIFVFISMQAFFSQYSRYPFILRDNGMFGPNSVYSCSLLSSVTSPVRRPGDSISRLYVAQTTWSPSRPYRQDQKDSFRFSDGLAAWITGKLTALTVNPLRESIQCFLFEFIFIAFSVFGHQGILYSRCTAFLRCRVHPPEAVRYEAPVFHVLPFSCMELDLLVRCYLKHMPREHFIDSMSLSPK